MTVHLKPLFNQRLLRDAVNRYVVSITDEQRKLATEWATSVQTHGLIDSKEKNLQGLFLSQIFDRLLGHTQVVSGASTYGMKPEHALKSVNSGKTPDACLGCFSAEDEIIRAVVELKAPGADLEAKQGKGYGQLTPIEQAFGYASKLNNCRWVIVSNFTTIRLYRYGSGQSTCHVFDLGKLGNDEQLEEFIFLLGQETLVNDSLADSVVDTLANRTHIEEERITKEFYGFYRGVRGRLFEQLEKDNPAPVGVETEAHQVILLEQAQKILDRILFICFCEDTQLLPPNIIHEALTNANTGFVEVSRWQQLQGLFDAVDTGHPAMKINAYNGGLFRKDPALDNLIVSDKVLEGILAISSYDFETDLNVNILGHIFEQSIADLEAIRSEILGVPVKKNKSKRNKHGVFYTPEQITRFIVSRTVGGWLDERFSELTTEYYPKGIRKSKERETKLYEDYYKTLQNIKIVDPACGSGAFLVAAFDYLAGEYERVNHMLATLRDRKSQLGLFDLDRQILQENLYGLDLNPESVEITKLSLWLKTAHADKPLNNLDNNIKCGNSLVAPLSDKAEHTELNLFEELPGDARPFDWQAGFPQVFEAGGFDVVLGNPPYVRQEVITPYKNYLEYHYDSYHGVADLYVYFYEKGLQLLNAGGKMAYIVTNKWFQARYGEPLRRLFTNKAVFEEIIDFGHAPIFEDADTFPCIVVCHHRGEDDSKTKVRICRVPRDRNTELSLEQFVGENSYAVPWSLYGAEAWSLEPPEVNDLMEKMLSEGLNLRDYSAVKPYFGVKTGFNEAFLIDDATRMKLVNKDPKSQEILKPYLRGRDIKRWVPQWKNLWMIFTRRGIDINAYPAVKEHLEKYRTQLEPCPADWEKDKDGEWPGRKKGKYKWYELQDPVDYWELFESEKIVYQDIGYHSRFALSAAREFAEATTFSIPSSDKWLLAVLCSPLMWWYLWRNTVHGKDEALRLKKIYIEKIPIPKPQDTVRDEAEDAVTELITLTLQNSIKQQELLDWLLYTYSIEKPGQKLEAYTDLTIDEFIAEVRKRKPKQTSKLKPSDIKALKEALVEYAEPARANLARITKLERRLSDLVNQAYSLTDDEVALMWKTAPPRMPLVGVQDK